jgi:ketosteroid isomerase-like protein
MSEQANNVDLAKRLINPPDGNWQPLLDRLADDVVFKVTVPEGTPISGEFRGKEAVTEHFERLPELLEFEQEQPMEFLGDGDRVVVLGRESFEIKRNGVTVRGSEYADVIEFRDGLIATFLVIQDLTAVVDAYRDDDRVEVVQRFFELMRRRDIDAWGELWHEDGRIIVFYPPEGFPSTIEGKDEILTGFQDLFAHFDSFEPELSDVYAAENSDAVCVEYQPRVTLTDGTGYTNKNMAVFRFKDGLVSAYHDYFDPRRFQTVVDRLAGV